MADLVAGVANCHNEHEAIEALPGLNADVLMLSEISHRGRELVGLTDYTYLTGAIPGASREVGILVSRRVKRLRLRGHWYEFVSAAAARFKRVGKERWGHVALVRLPDRTRVACVALHPVAGPVVLAGDDPNHPLVRRYASAMRWLEQTIAYHRSLGHEVIVGADINMREGTDRPWSPHAVFRENDMRWFWDGWDVLVWTPGLMTVSPKALHDFPSDHPALRAEFTAVKRRNR